MNLPLQLDRSAPIPLQDQLFEQLRQLILSGRLKPNTRLIATRFLAEQVGVSRRTVLFAYERLIAEGYLDTRPAIGTFVSPTLPDGAKPTAAANGGVDVPRQAALYPATTPPAVLPPTDEAEVLFDFTGSRASAATALPPKIWLRLMRDVLDAVPDIYAKPAPEAGVEPLRRIIADYLAATRGLVVSADQVFIVSGRRHACSLMAQLFRRRNQRVVLECPCDERIAGFFRSQVDEVVAVPVDEYGLDVDQLPTSPAGPGPSLAYVTPARQNPLGGTLPPSRRAALIEWARSAGAYIIEDDCDGELRYQGVAHPPLAAIDPYGLVFHVGTFAKVLGHGLSIGYLLVPPELRAGIAAVKSVGMENGQAFEQMVVANLLASGEYDHHLRRLRKNYLERRDSVISALKTQFGEVELMGAATGTQLTWVLPERLGSTSAVCEAAAKAGVRLRGIAGTNARLSPYCDKAVILDYAALAPNVVRDGIAALARALKTSRA